MGRRTGERDKANGTRERGSNANDKKKNNNKKNKKNKKRQQQETTRRAGEKGDCNASRVCDLQA